MDLVRDVLDKQIVDRHSDRMGKVDGLLLALEPGKAPRLIALEVGAKTLIRRWSERAAGWVGRVLDRTVGPGTGSTRFDVRHVRSIDIEVQLDVDADDTGARAVEHWLRDHVISRVPGSGVKG
jgi:hypothetical protein